MGLEEGGDVKKGEVPCSCSFSMASSPQILNAKGQDLQHTSGTGKILNTADEMEIGGISTNLASLYVSFCDMVNYLHLHDQRAQVNWEGEPPSKLLLFHLRVPNILLTLIPVV